MTWPNITTHSSATVCNYYCQCPVLFMVCLSVWLFFCPSVCLLSFVIWKKTRLCTFNRIEVVYRWSTCIFKKANWQNLEYIVPLEEQCHNSKSVIFQEKLLNVSKCYNFLWVQRRHNCSPAASFVNCVMTLYLLKVHLQINNWWIPTRALFHIQHCISLECWMWKSACVGIHQLLNWKMHGETLKFASAKFLPKPIIQKVKISNCVSILLGCNRMNFALLL